MVCKSSVPLPCGFADFAEPAGLCPSDDRPRYWPVQAGSLPEPMSLGQRRAPMEIASAGSGLADELPKEKLHTICTGSRSCRRRPRTHKVVHRTSCLQSTAHRAFVDVQEARESGCTGKRYDQNSTVSANALGVSAVDRAPMQPSSRSARAALRGPLAAANFPWRSAARGGDAASRPKGMGRTSPKHAQAHRKVSPAQQSLWILNSDDPERSVHGKGWAHSRARGALDPGP